MIYNPFTELGAENSQITRDELYIRFAVNVMVTAKSANGHFQIIIVYLSPPTRRNAGFTVTDKVREVREQLERSNLRLYRPHSRPESGRESSARREAERFGFH